MVFMHGICLFAFLIKEFVFPIGFVFFFAMGFGLLFLQFFKGFCFFSANGFVCFLQFRFFFARVSLLFFATLCISDRVLVWFW